MILGVFCYFIVSSVFQSSLKPSTGSHCSLRYYHVVTGVCVPPHVLTRSYSLTQCGDLNENVHHRLMGGGSIRKCGLVGVKVTLLTGVCHWGVGFEASEAQARPGVTLSSCCLLISRCGTLFLLRHDVCWHTTLLSAMMTMD